MNKWISNAHCAALALVVASPAAFSLTLSASTSLTPFGIDTSSIMLLCGGLAGIYAIRRRER